MSASPPAPAAHSEVGERHVASLDGLRGLMALVVIARHTFNAVDIPNETRLLLMQSPLALLQSGPGALHIFFILSAYVLTQSLDRERTASGVMQYGIRRVFRLHPPYVAGLTLTWLASFFFIVDPSTEPWAQHFASIHISPEELLAYFWFPGDGGMQMPVGWSLQVEMIYSLLLPAFVWFGGRGRGIPLLVLGAVVVAIDPEMRLLRWGIDFVIGVVLYQQRDVVRRCFQATPPLGRAAVVVVGWGLYSAPLTLGWSEKGFGIVIAGFDRRSVVVLALGGALIVASCIWMPSMRRIFSWRPLVLLGKWAYGIYMFHLALVLLLVPAFASGLTSYASLVLIVTVLVVPAAALFYYAFERPFVRLGNRACRALADRVGARAVQSRLLE